MAGQKQLTISEANGLHELLLVQATMIDKLACYQQEANSHELHSLFSSHLRKVENIYEELLSFSENIQQQMPANGFGQTYQPQSQGSANRQTVQPNPTGRIHERTMLTDCLIDCKTMASGAMTCATEISNPTLRRTVADVAKHHLDMAFELYKVAEAHGWYPELKPNESPSTWLRSTHQPVSTSGSGLSNWHTTHNPTHINERYPETLTPQAPANYATQGAAFGADTHRWATANHSAES